jgi:hypothetical protein
MIDSAYAYQMARFYRLFCNESNDIPPIFFLPPMIYKLKHPLFGNSMVYAEPNIISIRKFEKYTNNLNLCNNQLFSSFSHFSYYASGKLFLINDLQGKGFVLTDPAI